MVVRTLDPRQFIRLASETVPKINIDSNVSKNKIASFQITTYFDICKKYDCPDNHNLYSRAYNELAIFFIYAKNMIAQITTI